jgi:inosine-uridine nucleoside N-ribohydrolase
MSAAEKPHAAALVLDTDIGYDDILALAILLGRSELGGVLSTQGVSDQAAAHEFLKALLPRAGRSDVWLSRGGREPSSGGTLFPQAWRDDAATVCRAVLERYPDTPPSPAGCRQLGAAEASATQPATLLCCAPLTTVAQRLRRGWRPKRLVIMGGAIEAAGNIDNRARTRTSTAEWNFHADPAAAAYVLGAPIPKTLVPLDIRSPFPEPLARALMTQPVTPLGRIARAIVGCPSLQAGIGVHLSMWDVVATSVALDLVPYEMTQRRVSVGVEGAGGVEPGTLAESPDGQPVDVVSDFDIARLHTLLERLWIRS